MKLNVYSIYDSKAQAYNKPFYFHYDGEAIRAFADTVEDPKSVINRHPADYRLYRIGDFDDRGGVLKGVSEPVFVCEATQFVKDVVPSLV